MTDENSESDSDTEEKLKGENVSRPAGRVQGTGTRRGGPHGPAVGRGRACWRELVGQDARAGGASGAQAKVGPEHEQDQEGPVLLQRLSGPLPFRDVTGVRAPV